MEHGEDSTALAKFVSVFASLGDGRHLTPRLCEAARVTLDAEGASITIDRPPGQRVLMIATERWTERIAQLEDLADEGPAAEATTTGRVVTCTIGSASFERWPRLAELSEEAGLQGTFWAVPLRPARVVIGVLMLHRSRGSLDASPRTMQVVADAVGAALRHDPQVAEPVGVTADNWVERAKVYQASGMVMAQLGATAEDALAMLGARAFARNSDLLEVAIDVVDRGLDFSVRGEST